MWHLAFRQGLAMGEKISHTQPFRVHPNHAGVLAVWLLSDYPLEPRVE